MHAFQVCPFKTMPSPLLPKDLNVILRHPQFLFEKKN